MVKNYNKNNANGYVKIFTHKETKWQSLIREMVKLPTMNEGEYTIEQIHKHIDNISSKTHRVRAYKRFGKWLREKR